MPSSMKPAVSQRRDGPSLSKAEGLWRYFEPDLPEFPLPPDAVQAVRSYQGSLPSNMDQFAQLLKADHDKTSQPTK